MTYRTINEQDGEIRRVFPDFRLTAHADWIAVWEGPLKPASKSYRVRIVHFAKTIFTGWILANNYVTVHVVDPLIGGDMLVNEKLLPHIYWNDRNPAWPALCLWDPAEMFWTPEMSIAKTIIPWTSEWLLFFEYWQISGEFLGPGRHPPRRRKECLSLPTYSDPETHARRARFRNVEFHRIGRRVGVFGSYLWMGAALKACSLQLFSPSSNSGFWTASQSPSILIW
ncbi:hypothetical protein [Bradyrhizobium sp. 199]|uniref:hypothetical protein n=1 Tax=Bradyrhizobium sp. 199 TaxID=2782664 RepID=UPI001FFABFB5|nr:hypothetical protein [Bradyrhizobium sp. 199]